MRETEVHASPLKMDITRSLLEPWRGSMPGKKGIIKCIGLCWTP